MGDVVLRCLQSRRPGVSKRDEEEQDEGTWNVNASKLKVDRGGEARKTDRSGRLQRYTFVRTSGVTDMAWWYG